MRRWDNTSKRYTYVIGCSDYHDKKHPANKRQRTSICEILNQSNKNELLLVVEDVNSPSNSGDATCGTFFLNSGQGVLAQLTKECRAIGLDVVNLEYRYCRVIGLCGILAAPSRNPYQFQPACIIRMEKLLNEVEKTLDEVYRYQDGLLLRFIYSKECSKVKSWICALNIAREKQSSIAQFCYRYVHHANRLAWVKQMLTFDSALLDCKIVHHLINAPIAKRKLVVVAGGTHIDRVSAILECVGFEHVFTASGQLPRDKHIRHAVNVDYCIGNNMQPKPVNIDLLKHYIVDNKKDAL